MGQLLPSREPEQIDRNLDDAMRGLKNRAQAQPFLQFVAETAATEAVQGKRRALGLVSLLPEYSFLLACFVTSVLALTSLNMDCVLSKEAQNLSVAVKCRVERQTVDHPVLSCVSVKYLIFSLKYNLIARDPWQGGPDHQAERSTEEGAVERKAGQVLSQPYFSHYGCLRAIIMQAILDRSYVDAAPYGSIFFPDLKSALGRKTFVDQLRCREWGTFIRMQGV
ncbi:hypothetical protein llap_902 [Limosa lapponica baueri]|uniref:Uncharacterized protein n=1 Tax=Limosa lapponica baueri TaxID=1758121 RepID=A0A2I0US28_LIMLA|nr:hypothetical protein llap_902 [Limosa lapponica baueri]